MKWQRVLRWILVLVAVSTIALVAFSARKRQKNTGGTTVLRMDPKAVIESAGGNLLQLSGMKVPGFIDFQKQFVYDDGSMKLLGLKLTTHRAGREFYLNATEGKIGKEQSHVEARGNVVLTASDGLRMSTDEATYSNGEQMVRAPHKVEFSKGAMSGSGVGMTYDQKRDVLWLLDQVDITVAPDKKTNDPGAKITCGSIGFARREKYMRFERDVSIRRGGRTISADAVLAHLTDDEKKVKAWELRGNSHITMSDAADGGLQAMGSTDMNLTNGPDGETIQRALLAGGGAIQMAGAGGKPGRRIAANTIDVKLAEDSSGDEPVGPPAGAAHGAGRQGHAGARDSVGRHGRHGRAWQGTDRRVVSARRGVPRAAPAESARRTLAIAERPAHRGRRHGRRRVRRRHEVRGWRHDGVRARGEVPGEQGPSVADRQGRHAIAAGAGRPHLGRLDEDRHGLRGAEAHCDRGSPERDEAVEEGPGRQAGQAGRSGASRATGGRGGGPSRARQS